jgi:hypothetical protein
MRTPVLIAAAALAACSQSPDSQTAEQTAGQAATPSPPPAGTATAATTGSTAEPAAPTPSPIAAATPGKLPPADSAQRYVGRWAARQQLCDTGAWRFEPKRLTTAGEVSCDFDDVTKVPGGYDIAATCLAEGQTSQDTIRLRFAESAQAMLVSSKMWDQGLTYCGPVD